MFVRVGGIESGAVEQQRAIHEIHGDVRVGKAGRLQGEAIFRVADDQRNLLNARDRLKLRVCRANRGV